MYSSSRNLLWPKVLRCARTVSVKRFVQPSNTSSGTSYSVNHMTNEVTNEHRVSSDGDRSFQHCKGTSVKLSGRFIDRILTVTIENGSI